MVKRRFGLAALLVTFVLVVSAFLLGGCGQSQEEATSSEGITIVDGVNRTIKLDRPAKTSISTNPAPLRLYTYVCGTDGVVGTINHEAKNRSGRPYALANEIYSQLPTFGGSPSGKNEDYEKILEINPEVIFATYIDAATADKMQEKLGIPVIVLDYGKGVVFDPVMYNSIETIGKVMGREDRAKEVIAYMESIKDDLNERTKDIPDSEKLSAYPGAIAHKGSHGIESTRPAYPLFTAVNANNVVTGFDGEYAVMIDKEQIIEWDPEVIILDLAGIFNVQQDYQVNPGFYKNLRAFKNGRVYGVLPYVWSNVNMDTAMADAYFIGKTLYPEQFKDVNPVKKAGEIYTFLDGKDVYKEMAAKNGGFQQITLDDLANKKFKK